MTLQPSISAGHPRVVRGVHLAGALRVDGEQVVQGAVVDAAVCQVPHIAARHGVSFAAAGLAVCKDAHVVACSRECTALVSPAFEVTRAAKNLTTS